jgi:zinc transporter
MSFLIDQWNFSQEIPQQVANNTTVNSTEMLQIQAGHWYHCQRDAKGIKTWLSNQSIPLSVIDSLLAEDTRPIFEEYDEQNFLMILRGINLNENANPEDMLSVRVLFINGALITTRKIPSKTINVIRTALNDGFGPKTLPDLVIAIIDGLNKNIDNYLNSLENKISQYDSETELSEELMQTHKALFKMKRFIKPQQYAIDDLQNSNTSVADSKSLRLRHSVNTIVRINETLDFYLGEIDLIKGELRQYHAEKMNQNTYLFSVIAAIFLPTSFLTGLAGVNLGGIPGTDSPIAFTLFCLSLCGIFTIEWWLLRRLRFFAS